MKWVDVRDPTCPARSRRVKSICVEPALIIGARALNEHSRRGPVKMSTVTWVANVTGEGIYTGNMHDRSGFHNLSLQPESGPLHSGRTLARTACALPPRSAGTRALRVATHSARRGVPAFTRCSRPRVYRRRVVWEIIFHVRVLAQVLSAA